MEDDQGGGQGPSSTALKANSSQNLYYTGNSFELAAGASLSDDSGFVPHTNSSISSCGSSSRGLGLCRFEFEMAESDAEVSQFDSLDNFSDGGMSAENYNTLKKGPLAPIEPPPEFQDSPQTTLMRSQSLHNYSFRLTKSIISHAIIDLREMSCIQGDSSLNGRSSIIYFDTTSSSNSTQTTIAKCVNGGCRKLVQKKCRQHMYGSDSFLDQYDTGNIYDEPNSEYYDNHLLYSNVAESNEANDESINHSQIYDYDLYYYRKRNFTPVISHKRRRTPSVLFSPLHHHHHHYYHTNSSNSTGNRPNSRNSLTSRLSSSHNSLHVPGSNKADDSIFITQAMSHDALVGRGEISDLYNVPIDSDIYALPVDSVGINNCSDRVPKQGDNYSSNIAKHRKKCVNSDLRLKPKSRYTRNKRRRRQNLQTSKSNTSNLTATASSSTIAHDKRHSVPENRFEPMQMTLDEVKRYYHNLYSSSSESGNEIIGITTNVNAQPPNSYAANATNTAKTKDPDNLRKTHKSSDRTGNSIIVAKSNDTILEPLNELIKSPSCSNNKQSSYKVANVSSTTTNAVTTKRGTKEIIKANINNNTITSNGTPEPGGKYGISGKKSQFSITFNLRQKFCNIFRFKSRHNSTTKNGGPDTIYGSQQGTKKQANGTHKVYSEDRRILLSSRALPPLPGTENGHISNGIHTGESGTESGCEKSEQESEKEEATRTMDFAANIEKVKEYGWYWGPISSEGAEKILSNEPDGSFIVRDSSDDHYIFSLTFKLDGCVRHVRIEQDQGTFSFGSCAKFKSRTIMEFIENAVEHSRSGRYLFFLHRRPEHGPMRVQLTNPVSRFKHIQSLQHMCRFVILKSLKGRKDLIQTLPLPRRILDYLSYKNVFSEQVESDSSSQSQVYGENNDATN